MTFLHNRNAKSQGAGIGLLHIPISLLWVRIHLEFSDSSALPVYQVRPESIANTTFLNVTTSTKRL